MKYIFPGGENNNEKQKKNFIISNDTSNGGKYLYNYEKRSKCSTSY